MRNLQTTLVQKNSVYECKRQQKDQSRNCFYFTRISEIKCNKALDATQTHTSSIILCVLAGCTFGCEQSLALRDENTLYIYIYIYIYMYIYIYGGLLEGLF